MVVDDHPLVRSAVRDAISGADVEVVAEAASGEEALATAPGIRPDILLLDIDLPGVSGLRVVRELAPRLPETQIVMLTVSRSERDLVEAVRLGAVGYLTKDMPHEALSRAIRGIQRGELAMTRQMARRLVKGLSGAARPREDAAGLAALTGREFDVLRLLAEGLTDREIAASLTVSPRTVETHVANILRKLDARNRAEAAARYRSLSS